MNLSIKYRLMIIALAATLGFLVLLFLLNSSINSTRDLSVTKEYVEKLKGDMLKLIKSEKEFLTTKDIKLKDEFNMTIKNLHEHSTTLSNILISLNIDNTMLLQLDTKIEQYNNIFNQVVEKQKLIGLKPTDGLYGSLRKSAHDAMELTEKVAYQKSTIKMLELRRHEKDFMLRKDKKYLEKFNIDIRKAQFMIRSNKTHFQPEQKQLAKDLLNTYQKDFNALVVAEEEKGFTLTSGLVGKLGAINKECENDLNTLAKNLEEEIETTLNSSKLQAIIIALVITIAVIIFTILVSRSVVNGIGKLSKAVKALMRFSSADQKIDIDTKDEIGQLARQFNDYMAQQRAIASQDQKVIEELGAAVQMAKAGFFNNQILGDTDKRSTQTLKKHINDMLHDLNEKFNLINEALMHYGNANFNHDFNIDNASGKIGSIVYSTKSVGNNVSELLATIMISGEQLTTTIDTLSSSATSLSQSATQQAASLEETSASIEEIVSNIQESTQNIVHMSKLSDDVINASNLGQDLATKTSASMVEINNQVTAINEAITVIDQIAFQTNILSLNAAVEAATAGEAGKGFAVVAGEVRNLASRSAEAAQEIKELVSNANTKAIEGKNIATEMIQGYTNLSAKITENKQMIDKVEIASKRQNEAIVQINNTINILDKNTQENASDAMNIDKLSHEVRELSDRLINMANKADYKTQARDQVCDIDLTYQLNGFKLSHIQIKEDSFENRHSHGTSEAECELGRWIQEQELSQLSFTQTPNWQKLKDAHASFHNGIKEYVKQEAAKALNETLIDISNRVEKDTGILFDTLDQIKVDNCKG